MILRPAADADLVSLITSVLTDRTLRFDTRAMLAALLARRGLENCPVRDGLAGICKERGQPAGQFRLNRMIRDAVAAGYMVRANWAVPRVGRSPAYSFVVGSRRDIADVKARARADG